MTIDNAKIQEIFDYLSVQDKLERADGAFVFGRADVLLAQLASDAYNKGLAKYILFTGGVGKDSGYLPTIEMSEANFLAACVNVIYHVPGNDIFRETKATNGGENARFGLKLILDNDLSHNSLIIIAHATSLRRLAATLQQELENQDLNVALIRQATAYSFDAANPADQLEACSELVRLVGYAEKRYLKHQDDLPINLVSYAREVLETKK